MATALGHLPGRSGGAVTRRRFLGVVSSAEPDVARHWLRLQRRAMACSFEITLDQADAAFVPAAQAALNQIDAIEAQLTVFRETSAIVELNRRAAAAETFLRCGTFRTADAMRRLVARHRRRVRHHQHAAQPLLGISPSRGPRAVGPRDRTARAIWSACSTSRLDPRRSTVRFLKTGVELNLGAIGKGYALDRVGGDAPSGRRAITRCCPRAAAAWLASADAAGAGRSTSSRRGASARSRACGCATPRSARAAPARSS